MVTCPASVTYNGAAQTPCTVAVTGAGGLNLTPAATYAANTAAGTATASYAFAGDGNYLASSDSAPFTIAKALVTASAGGGSTTYDGLAKTPAACVVAGLYTGDLTCVDAPASVGPNAGTTVIEPAVSGTGLANFAITPVNGAFVIDKAATATVVTCPTSVTYNGAAQTPCTVAVTGAGGLNLTPAASYVANTAAGTATADYTFAGDSNYLGEQRFDSRSRSRRRR